MMKKTAICLVISFGVAFLLLWLEGNPVYQVLDLKLYDVRMNLRRAPAEDPRVLFVEMDEEAVNNLGRWPWPRNIFAHIVDTLNALGARQIIFDVTFAQPTQVIIDKDAVEHIFLGRQQIDDYIADETGVLKAQTTVPAQDAVWTLNQVRDNLQIFTDVAEQKLENALIDNDLILSGSLGNSPSFIGYSFEVITEHSDLRKERSYPLIMAEMAQWVERNFEAPFDTLPANLKKQTDFSTRDLEQMFHRAKIRHLIDADLETSPEEASRRLRIGAAEMRPDFYLIKQEKIRVLIRSVLEKNPEAGFLDIIYQYEIFDHETQQLFRDAYTKTRKIFEAQRKFARPAPEEQSFLIAKNMEAPIASFTQAVKGGGFLNGIPHQDGVLRFIPLFIKYDQRIFPHIAIASILDLYKPASTSFEPGKFFVLHQATVDGQLKDIRIPIDENATTLINWTGRWKDTFRHVSAADVYRLYYLKDTLATTPSDSTKAQSLQQQMREKELSLAQMVKDSICIIGLTAAGTHDFNPIPYESTYPMVGTHGSVLNSILTQQFIARAPDHINRSVLFSLAVFIGLSLAFLSSANGLIFTVAILTGVFGASLYWFDQGVWLNLASPSLLSLFAYLGITSYKFSTEERSKREIKRAFSKYVSPDVIEEIIRDPSKLRLGGSRRELSVMFSDIRGFTGYSEKRNPEEVVGILNEYLDAMTKVIVEHKGTLDKYVGDEIMAVFGAPHFQPPQASAKSAVICAIRMLERLSDLHDKWRREGLEPLDIGIGINTGDMVVGNMGSELRMDYTVIGDAVNLGARVEALTRQFQTRLIITDATYQYVKDIVEVKSLEAIKVKGKEIPVMIYEVLALKDSGVQPAG